MSKSAAPKRIKIPIELPILVAKLPPQKPGRPRKVPGLNHQLSRWLEIHENTNDIHEALREGFRVTLPRWFISLSLKAESGDPVAIKLALEWWSKWKSEDVARTLNVTPDRATSAGWVAQAVDPTGELGHSTEKNDIHENVVSNADNKDGLHAGTPANIEEKSDL